MEKRSLQTLTPKQKVYVQEVVKGSPKNLAAVRAGYAPGASTSNIESPIVKNAMIDAMTRAGITEEALTRKIREGLKAHENHYYTFEGRVVDSRKTADFSTRHKYLLTSLELLKYIKNPSIENLNIGLIQIPSAPEQTGEWNDTDKKPEPAQLATNGAIIS